MNEFEAWCKFEQTGKVEDYLNYCNAVAVHLSLIHIYIMIRVAIHKMQVKFTGTDLSIKCLNSENIIIQGTIRMVEYLD